MAQSEQAVELTPAALARIQHFLDARGGEGMRFGVRKSGCSGWAYVVDIADSIKDDDHVFEQDGIKVVIDDKSLSVVRGTRIDFVREGLNQVFHFENPQVTGECGCGESFAVSQ